MEADGTGSEASSLGTFGFSDEEDHPDAAGEAFGAGRMGASQVIRRLGGML